jgi:hypothetical protein
MAAHPEFGGGNPSDNVLNFLTRIDTADPNSGDFSEDDTNASWGHSQFIAGNLTWSSVLTSWSDVGSCSIASRLLAAVIKACKVSRHLCFERQIATSSYLSDIYLEQTVEALWKLWREAGGVSQLTPSFLYSITNMFICYSQFSRGNKRKIRLRSVQ